MPTAVCPRRSAVPPALVARWRAVPVTIACDVTARPVLLDPAIRPLRSFGGAALAGPAVTAWCERGDFGAVLHAIEAAGPGDVLAVAADGRLDTAVIGELLCGAARLKRIAGLVVDGAVRDVATLAGFADFPVLARGATARGPLSKDRGTVNAPVALGGVTCSPGDLILADDDGAVALTPALAAAAIEAAEARVAAEAGWRSALDEGRSVLDVFAVPQAV